MNKFQKIAAQCAKDDLRKPFAIIRSFRYKRNSWNVLIKEFDYDICLELKNENKLLPF